MKHTLLKNEFGHLEMELWNGEPLLHLTLKKWSKSLYLMYKDIWRVLLSSFKEEGYYRVLIAIPSSDKKLIKFEKMFGFIPVCEKEGVLFMEKEV